MKAIDVYNHLKSKGTWVNWNTTCDQFLYGDENMEITGIAVGWMATFPNLEQAKKEKCNLYITHEPIYVGGRNSFGIMIGGSIPNKTVIDHWDTYPNGVVLEEDDIWVKKTEWLKANDMVIMRCHDVWDDFPEIGIHGAWAKWLGFDKKPIQQVKFYEVHDVSNRTLGDVATQISQHCESLGQQCVHVIGDLKQNVTRIAFGTGAITNYRLMRFELDADVLVLTDDGTRLWESGQWAIDSGVGVIVVNHATAEEPGMISLAKYLGEQFPSVKSMVIRHGCLYQTI